METYILMDGVWRCYYNWYYCYFSGSEILLLLEEVIFFHVNTPGQVPTYQLCSASRTGRVVA